MVEIWTCWVNICVGLQKYSFFPIILPAYPNSSKTYNFGVVYLKNGCSSQKNCFDKKGKTIRCLNRLDMVIKKVPSIGETLYIDQIFYIFF